MIRFLFLFSVMCLGLSEGIAQESYVYVANFGNNSISVIDTRNDAIVATIPDVFPGRIGFPISITITPDGQYAYVENFANSDVRVIDTVSHAVIANISFGLKQSNALTLTLSVAITPNGKYAYVSHLLNDTVSVIDTTSNTIITTISGLRFPWRVAFTPDSQYSYLINDNLISIINTTNNTILANISGGELQKPTSIAITPNGQYAYVADYNNMVHILDIASNTITATVCNSFWQSTFGGGLNHPDMIAITPNGQYAYMINNFENICVIDTTSNTILTTISGLNQPGEIAFTPDSHYAYVTNTGNNTVSVINTATHTIVATLYGFNQPWGIAISSQP